MEISPIFYRPIMHVGHAPIFYRSIQQMGLATIFYRPVGLRWVMWSVSRRPLLLSHDFVTWYQIWAESTWEPRPSYFSERPRWGIERTSSSLRVSKDGFASRNPWKICLGHKMLFKFLWIFTQCQTHGCSSKSFLTDYENLATDNQWHTFCMGARQLRRLHVCEAVCSTSTRQLNFSSTSQQHSTTFHLYHLRR